MTDQQHDLEVAFCARGYITHQGYRITGGHAQVWHTRAEAAMAARIAAPGFSAQPAHTAFTRRLWVLHNEQGGGFLTPAGWAQAQDRWMSLRMTPGIALAKGLRVDDDLATARYPQANGDVRYIVYRVLDGALLAAETVMFIDRDRYERDHSQRFKTFTAGVLQANGFFPGSSCGALQVGFAATLTAALDHVRVQLASNPVGALDAHPSTATRTQQENQPA